MLSFGPFPALCCLQLEWYFAVCLVNVLSIPSPSSSRVGLSKIGRALILFIMTHRIDYMTTRNSLVTTRETGDSRNVDDIREQVGLAPQLVSSMRKKPNKPTVRPLGGPFKPQAEPACITTIGPGGACSTIVAQNPPLLSEMSGAGVWCNAQVLDLVRHRRGPDRSQSTKPSPSMHAPDFPLPVSAE